MELSKAKSSLPTLQDTPVLQIEATSHNAGAPFKINIANKGRTTSIETHSGQSISDLKNAYREANNLDGSNVVLKFRGTELNDDSTVGETALEKNCKIMATIS